MIIKVYPKYFTFNIVFIISTLSSSISFSKNYIYYFLNHHYHVIKLSRFSHHLFKMTYIAFILFMLYHFLKCLKDSLYFHFFFIFICTNKTHFQKILIKIIFHFHNIITIFNSYIYRLPD